MRLFKHDINILVQKMLVYILVQACVADFDSETSNPRVQLKMDLY